MAARLLLCALLHTVVGAVLTAEPTAVITGPGQALPGDLVVLDASGSQASGFAWVLADSDKSFLPVDEGQRVVFATGTTGRYTFILVTAQATPEGQPRVAIARHVVTIGDGPAPPVPPAPVPPLPPGRFDLARQARDWAALVNLAASDRQRTARLVATSFETVATAIAAGTVASIPDALAKLVAANQAALAPPEHAGWKNHWNPPFQAAMTRLDGAGKLATLSDVADAFREIALGLKAVATSR